MLGNLRIIKSAFLTTILLISFTAFAEDEALVKAAALIKNGDSKAAYKVLEPLEDERSGDVNYDYLLGVSAIDSGNVTRGVFALERVLAVQPNNSDARAHIARAYYLLGENETARSEFKNTLSQNPSETTSSAINRYMSAIDKSLGLVTTFNAYLEGAVGHDSNVNSATSASSVAVPAFGGLILNLSKGARKTSDNFLSLAGGASFRTPVANNLSLFGVVNGTQKSNADDTIFDTSSIDFNVGLRYKHAIDTYTVAVQDSNFYVDGDRFRHSYGTTGQWSRDLNETNQVNAYVQLAKLEYPENSIRDANRYVGGGGWAHVFAGDKTPVLFLSGYAGKEKAKDSDFDFLGNDIYGARAGGQLTLNPKLVAFSTLGYEYRDYDGRDPFFDKTRKDDQYDFAVGLRYLPGYDWVIKPQLSYLQNESNIKINDFDRTVLSVSFRHDFNW